MGFSIDSLADGEKDRVTREIVNLIIKNKASISQAVDILDMVKTKLYELPVTEW